MQRGRVHGNVYISILFRSAISGQNEKEFNCTHFHNHDHAALQIFTRLQMASRVYAQNAQVTHEAIVWSKPHPKDLTSLLNRASDWMAEHHLSFQQLHEKDVSIGVTTRWPLVHA